MNPITHNFEGLWVGESMNVETSPAHLWRIARNTSNWLFIYHKWEGEDDERGYFSAIVTDEGRSFQIGAANPELRGRGELIDDQHFVIRGWDTNDIRGGRGPHFDVVFSRPGIAELNARAVYRKFIERQLANEHVIED
jgi:hypothetical protein